LDADGLLYFIDHYDLDVHVSGKPKELASFILAISGRFLRQSGDTSLPRPLIEVVVRCSPWIAGGLDGYTTQNPEGHDGISEQLNYLRRTCDVYRWNYGILGMIEAGDTLEKGYSSVTSSVHAGQRGAN
jgi:hypothetical protein